MVNIIEVRFHSRGKPIHCDAGDMRLQVNDHVVVNTNHGPDMAIVVSIEPPAQPVDQDEQIMTVIRKADIEDLEKARQDQEEETLTKCKEMVGKLGLKMKPLAARYDMGSGHLTIFFSARQRVDFRGLVWKLSRSLETRVELRQVGSRDEAKLIGGMGRCGYPLCCRSFLSNFTSVSIKMAKEQNLALNPMRISGICGRLLCCLAYENKEYVDMKSKMPQPNQEVLTPLGKARVISINPLKETVTVKFDNEIIKELPLNQLVQKG